MGGSHPHERKLNAESVTTCAFFFRGALRISTNAEFIRWEPARLGRPLRHVNGGASRSPSGLSERITLHLMAKKKPNPSKAEPTIENRRARHEYFISETLEVGVVLVGTEVKSVRAGKVSLNEGFVLATSDASGRVAMTLHQVSIGEYAPGGTQQHRLDRARVLLAHKREICKLARQLDQKGATIVPLKMYFKEGRVKLLLGIGTGRADHDKRRAIAERESKRELQRLMSRRG